MMEPKLLFIKWDGPFSANDINSAKKIFNEHGLYQIYAHHPVFGAGALVYIGKAQELTFAARLNEHLKFWLGGENDVSFRLGRLHRDYNHPYEYDQEWKDLLSEVEILSVFWNTPPYNSQYIKEYKGKMKLRILNSGNRGSIMMEYSTPWWVEIPQRIEIPQRPDDSAER